MIKRSPRYPRSSLAKSVEMIDKLFKGAHQSKLDVDTAAKILGYSNSSGGAASSALGALRQFGLVDGLRGDVRVSDLAMRIIQPMNASERSEALREAAAKPDIFGKLMTNFSGRLPTSNEPIRAFLIRSEGFSAAGAEDLINALRDTLNSLPEITGSSTETADLLPETDGTSSDHHRESNSASRIAPPSPSVGAETELIVLPLGPDCRAELRLYGSVSQRSYSRLISHLELLKETLVDE